MFALSQGSLQKLSDTLLESIFKPETVLTNTWDGLTSPGRKVTFFRSFIHKILSKIDPLNLTHVFNLDVKLIYYRTVF